MGVPAAVRGRPRAAAAVGEVDLSVVMPCLNEAETLEACILKARDGIRAAQVHAEIIVADNGSTDGSQALAESLGARVVHVTQRGYGSALIAGIAAARGRWVIMGDADDSYDFREVPKFVSRLREGYDFVQGCRLPSGGGAIREGAMPPLHRWLGNPMLSAIARLWFRAPLNDVYCGLRGFSRDVYASLGQRCGGMEFAVEMVVKMSLSRARICEVPITLHKDGRTRHAPHLRTWRDGWRTLRFFLLLSPRWLFFVPGLALMCVGALSYAAGFLNLSLGRATFDVSTMLFGSLFTSVGFQAVLFGILAKVFAINERLLPGDYRLFRGVKFLTLERGLIVGVFSVILGLALLGWAVLGWRAVSFGSLDYAVSLRVVIPGTMLALLGVQLILASFFLSILGMQTRVAGSVAVVSAEGLAQNQ